MLTAAQTGHFAAGSGIIGSSIALNAVSTHGACTAVFVFVAAFITFLFASLRTLGRMSWIAWIGLCSIMIAGKFPTLAFGPRPLLTSLIITVSIAVGVQERPAEGPQEGACKSDYHITNHAPFFMAISARHNIGICLRWNGSFLLYYC